MDRLWALKNDFDPVGRISLGSSGAGFSLPHHPMHGLSMPLLPLDLPDHLGPSNSLLGQANCWRCKRLF